MTLRELTRKCLLLILLSVSTLYFTFAQVGFEETFYQGYPDYDVSFQINKIDVTDDGYDLALKGFTNRFTTAQTDPLGNRTNQGSIVEIPEFLPGTPTFFTLRTSLRLSNGDILASHNRSPNNLDGAIYIIHYDSDGNTLNEFSFDLPNNPDFISGVGFEELEDGRVFMLGSYTLENTNSTRNIIPATYNPATQNFTQNNEFLWGDFSTSFAIRRIELAPDGNFFVHFYQSSSLNAHYVSKLSADGTELWRIQVSTLERPVDDLVPTSDGGVWVSNGFFNTVRRYDTDGNQIASLPMFDVQNQVQNFFEVKGITLAVDNGIAMVANTGSNLGTAVFGGDGSIIQINVYEEYEPLEFAEGFSTPDGGFAFGGYAEEIVNNFLTFRPRFVKTNSFGEILPVSNGSADLSLSISGSTETPDIWTSHSITVSLTNEGSENTTGIEVNIPQSSGGVYSGSNEFTSSQGDFNPYGNQNWEVGTLAAGTTATITINYFRTSNDPFFQYAQVIAMNESDVDSAPDNGNGSSVNEDDEAVYPDDNPIDPCNPDVTNPIIANCPQDITITTETIPVQVFWEEPTVSDNCGGASLISNWNSGDSFFEDIFTVNYNSVDGVGNPAECSFTITVILDDTTPPSGACDNNILQDPGFEIGFSNDGWKTLGGGGQTTNDAYTGNQAMEISGNGSSRIFQNASAGTPGETYTLKAFAKTTDASAYSDIYIKFLSSSYQPLDTPSESIESTIYQEYSITATAPANTAFIEIGLRKSSGDYALFADEWCFEAGTVDPPTGEMGCYFEEIYDNVPSSVSSRSLDASENNDGSISLRLFDQSANFDLTLRAMEVDANGNFESFSTTGNLPYPTVLTSDGFLIGSGSSTTSFEASLFQFGTGTLWDRTYTISEASSISIVGGGEIDNGFIFTGTITQGGVDDVFYPILIRLDLDGNLLGYNIEAALDAFAFVDFYKEASNGFFIRIYSQASASTTVVKTDINGNWLWSVDFPNGHSSVLTRVSEATDGFVYVSILGGAPDDPAAPISVAEFYKLDNTGNMVWTTVWGFPQGVVAKPAIEAVDGGAVFSYITRVNGVSTFNYRKLGNSNDLLWSKTYGAIEASIQFQTQDGGLLFAGTDEIGMGQGNFMARPYLLKTTSEGNLLPLCEEDPPPGDPDLTLSNLDAPANVLVGETISYTFSLSNIGDELVAGNFNIKAYFSEDDVLDGNDVFDGLVPTGNIAASQTINNIQGASLVPNLPDGDYYLILKIDADDAIAESNENNNTISQLISVGSDDPPPGGCDALEPVASDFPWHEWLSKVTLSLDVEWESGKSPYSDFTQTAPIADYERGALGSFIFDITYSYFTYDAYIRYYIDFNQNGIFEEDEFGSVLKSAIPPGNNVVATRGAALAIPETALLGETRARIIVSRSPIVDACTDIAFGEIEDYTVNIVDEIPNVNQRVGINEAEVLVYPNPANEEVTIEIDNGLPAKTIELYDARGLIKQQIVIDQQENLLPTRKISLLTSELINGVYFIKVSGDNFKPRTKRVMIQRTY